MPIVNRETYGNLLVLESTVWRDEYYVVSKAYCLEKELNKMWICWKKNWCVSERKFKIESGYIEAVGVKKANLWISEWAVPIDCEQQNSVLIRFKFNLKSMNKAIEFKMSVYQCFDRFLM